MAETNPLPPPAPGARSPLWVRMLLVASLAFNLLVIGMVAGAVVSGGGPGGGRDLLRDLSGTPFVRALSPEDRRALLRELRREGVSLREARAALRGRFEALLATLRADDLDVSALEAILDEQRAAGAVRQDLGQRLIIGRIESMSLAERRAYADRLEAEVRRRRQP